MNEVALLDSNEAAPGGGKKLCTIMNEYPAFNSEGKWKVLVDSKNSPAGMAIPPNEEFLLFWINRKESLKDCVWSGFKKLFPSSSGNPMMC